MEHLFSLNAEGGPLICVDANAAVHWNGTEGGARDYADLCIDIDAQPEFSAKIMPIAGVLGVVWEMKGAGNADVFVYTDGRIKIMRAWLGGDSNNELLTLTDCAPISRRQLGVIHVPSGVLAVIWAPESGCRVPHQIDTAFKRVKGTAVAGSVFAVKATKGQYSCWDEIVDSGDSSARLLTLTPG